MATTKIKPVKTNLRRVINYALNGDKTDQMLYTGCVNTDPASAYNDMVLTKQAWRTGGKYLAFHAHQAFKPGEVTPEQAHRIGMEFARQMWGERFEVVVGTHLDRGHLHNHFVVNSVSFLDGGLYHDNKKSYYGGIRMLSDQLCREHGLSVIEHSQGRGQPYREYMNEKEGKPNQNAFIKGDIDAAIAAAFTWNDFINHLKKQGYTVRWGPNVKHMTVKPPGAQRARRLDSLKDSRYTEDAIRARLARQRSGEPEPPARSQPKEPARRYKAAGPVPRPRRKLRGFIALYYKYLYLLGAVKRRKAPGRIPYHIRADVAKLDRYSKQFRFLHSNGIETTGQLDLYGEAVTAKMDVLREARAPLYSERRNAPSEEDKARISEEITAINTELRTLSKDIAMCNRIRSTAPTIAENTRAMEESRERREPAREQERQRKPRNFNFLYKE